MLDGGFAACVGLRNVAVVVVSPILAVGEPISLCALVTQARDGAIAGLGGERAVVVGALRDSR